MDFFEDKSPLEEREQRELSKPGEAVLPYRYEKRPARLDITRASKDDHRYPRRFTRKEIENQLKKDYKYMKGKAYMMIQPFLVMLDYPYKKRSSDSDVPDEDGKNVDMDNILVFGRLPHFRSCEEYKNKKSYLIGDLMYVKRGYYWVEGESEPVYLKPHFAMVIKKKREKTKVKSRRIRDLFDPVKTQLETGKPFRVYKEFPKIKEVLRRPPGR